MIARMSVPKLAWIVLLVAFTTLGGCDYVRGLATDAKLPFFTRKGSKVPTQARAYPSQSPLAAPLDVEVLRDGNAILLHNHTVQDFQAVELWLNQEYGAELPFVPIGQGQAMALTSFVNRHGEHYPVAQFLRPELDRTLVSAELVVGGKLHKITVRLQDDWRRP